MANKYAVLVGCNYPNTENELRGCVNDVTHMRRKLIKRFCFPEDNITLMIDTDTDSACKQPTRENIVEALTSMILKAKSEDVLFFHFSGHGSKVDAEKPHSRPGHTQDECIVACDLRYITDLDFRRMVNKLAKGASFTMMCDSCFSGELIYNEKEQIGPAHVSPITGERGRPKFIPAEFLIADKAKKSAAVDDENETVDGDTGILLSGCQSDELSTDGHDESGHPCGVFSNAVDKVLAATHGKAITNKELVLGARKSLEKDGRYPHQHPCLYCSDINADVSFLRQA